ncbi:hypothetical protein [Pseudomonas oryzihabitans]|uniref:Uncharacterized protein n=1 Tax=Pseudomonas oryzihabitans TaxID=47885 RepID=A0AAJ2BEM1_9PSED|nr:hypothetical protein [Pseudomonas psychrotolerans]MDR6232654.1 hypothetical protein [Pseudomonas psychrotolerans]
MTETAAPSCELIICAPLRGDAASLQRLFTQGYHTRYLSSLDEVAAALGDETGIIVFTEEALRQNMGALSGALERQPTWSDIPLVLLASDAKRSGPGQRSAAPAVARGGDQCGHPGAPPERRFPAQQRCRRLAFTPASVRDA